jgi:hypothetical protein
MELSQSCSNTIDEVLQIWFIANVPTTQKRNAIAKLKVLYNFYVKIGKNKPRRTEKQLKLETDWINKLSKLFDVAHADCDRLIKIQQDIMFLKDQREKRKMVMGTEDLEFKEREKKRVYRHFQEEHRKKKATEVKKYIKTRSVERNSDSEYEETGDEELLFSKYHQQKSKKIVTLENHPIETLTKQNKILAPKPHSVIDSSLFIASLDRTKTTSVQAMHIVGPVLKAVGIDIKDITLSASSIYRARKTIRKSIVQNIQETFVPNTPLVAHFDSKILPDTYGNLADRMPIIISGLNVEKLLAIPKLSMGTGELMGNSVVEVLEKWKDVPDWLAGLCFDTTSSNTGVHTGAITIIQQAYDKRLLFLACRHHILEIILAAVFDQFFQSSGPQIGIFRRFKEHWKLIDTTQYSSIETSDIEVKSELTVVERVWINQKKKNMSEFLRNQLSLKNKPRKDYLELIQLTLITLGENYDVTHFSPPGAYHRARWMAKGIYCLKIYLFRRQFKLTAYELQGLRRICLFIITIYAKIWLKAPNSSDAPYNDLCLLQTLESYLAVDKKVADIAIKKMRGHMWYLSEDLIGLALFSDLVPNSEKEAMIVALKKPPMKTDLRRVDSKLVDNFQVKTLSDFVTQRSMNLFTALKIEPIFLTYNPAAWIFCPVYLTAKQKIASMRVTNDCAERAVKLATDFNNVLTLDEAERQLIFQIVDYHRKLMTIPLKKNFKANSK